MGRRGYEQLQEIQAGAVSSAVPLGDMLLKVITLGPKYSDLVEWARREVRGYELKDEVPGYRVVAGNVHIVATMGGVRHDQQLKASEIPQYAKDHIQERTHLRTGVPDIEATIRNGGNGFARVRALAGDALKELSNKQHEHDDSGWYVNEVYWSVPVNALGPVLSHIRAELVAKVSDLLPDAARETEAEVVATAVPSHKTQPGPPWWKNWKVYTGIGTFIVGVATIVGVVIEAIK